MTDIEGAICDECGARIGPNGCCATARARKAIAAELLDVCKAIAERIEECPDCDGSGLEDRENACGRCGGQGLVLEYATGLISDLKNAIARAGEQSQ
jgi:DnaJ-class molecular chaperone